MGLPCPISGKECACQCRSHRFDSCGKIPRALEQLTRGTTATEPVLWIPGAATLEPVLHSKSPHSLKPEESSGSSEDPAQPKINKQNYIKKKMCACVLLALYKSWAEHSARSIPECNASVSIFVSKNPSLMWARTRVLTPQRLKLRPVLNHDAVEAGFFFSIKGKLVNAKRLRRRIPLCI